MRQVFTKKEKYLGTVLLTKILVYIPGHTCFLNEGVLVTYLFNS
jgi:hypothetical protein